MIYQKLAGSSASDYVPVIASGRAPAVPAVPPEPRFDMPGLEAFDDILARPLFASSRRPVFGSSPTASVVVSQTLGLSLMGVSISSSDKFALVAPSEGGSAFRLREGEDYQGWSLSQIQSNNILFRQGGREQRLELSYDVAPAPPVTKRKTRRQNVTRRIEPAQRESNVPDKGEEPPEDDASDERGIKDD